ncbi:MAG: sugar ABC transporter ATP-binding protein [Actinobacteria bacterium]|nr:sugar ABC transporter ATP-binding protein [Actinomycetota bacterium]
MSSKEIVSMRGIVKRFQGVTALDGVDFSINAGEVMCLLGENGAGKSTLIKILSGSYTPDAGEIFFEGKAVTIKTPRMATELGISVVHQELDLVPDLTVAQNLFLGRTPSRFGFIKNSNMQEVAEAAIARVGGQFSPKTKVSELTVVQKQLTMIARALTIEAKLLIMDEPSATLTADELQQVFRVMDEVTKAGCAE